MLVGIVRFCKGTVEFTATGKFPERLLNLAAARGVALYRPRPVEGGFRAGIDASDYRRLRHLARRAGVRTRIEKKRGLPFILRRYRGRVGLFAGAALGALVLVILSQFLWSFRILGAENLSEQKIRDILAENGVTVGAYKGDLDVELIERRILRECDDITWLSINLFGCTADVEVREKAKKPEILSTAPCNVKAAADGVITKIKAREGYAKVSEGSGVRKGDLLVSGVNTTKQGGARFMHAEADIFADVYSERELKIPKQSLYYSVSENKFDRSRLSFLWWELPASLCFTRYDNAAVSVNEAAACVNDIVLPLAWKTETVCELTADDTPVDGDTAREIFRADELLYEAFARPDSRPVRRDLTVSEDSEGYSCQFDCVFNENIAETSEFSVTEE